jgi:serine-protein kinase ATM
MTEFANDKIGIRTARNIAKSIIKIIWSEEEGFYKPLSNEFIRSLSQILEYQPHVEHFRDDWHTVLAFCLKALGLCCSTYSELTTSLTLGRSMHSSVAPSSDMPKPEKTREDADLLLKCVRHLCHPPNSPIYHKGSDITQSVVVYLQSIRTYGSGYPDALAILNLLAQRLAYTNLAWAKSTVLSAFPILAELWILKKPPLCHDILVFLSHVHLHISGVLQDFTNSDFRDEVERLLENMSEDYSTPTFRQQLEIDDIILGIAQSSSHPIEQLGGLRCSFSRTESESCWATVYFLAYISALLDTIHAQDGIEDAMEVEGLSRKRQRTSSQLEGLLRSISSSLPAAQTAALQVLSFYMSLQRLSPDQIETVLDTTIPLISGMSNVMSSWGLLVLCQVALHKKSGSPSLSGKWLQVWELAARLVPSSNTSRVACYVLDVLLRANIVPYSAVSHSLNHMLEVAELSGPAILAESSVSFWISFLTLKLSENPSSSRGLAEKLLRWLFRNWTPSMFSHCLMS